MSFTVFYAWQSDRDQGVCHYFIRDAAKAAVKEVAKDAKLKSAPSLDHDIQGEVGLIHIADTVKRKIRRAGIFIADLTHVWTYRTSIGRKKRVTNANVAIPPMDGLTFLFLLREKPAGKEVPVIVISGQDDPRTLQRARELGVHHYLVKSQYKTRELLDLVRGYCLRSEHQPAREDVASGA